jgi:hypothetical protein
MNTTFRVVRPGADVLVTLQVFEEGPDIVCGLRRIEGRIDLRPKALRAAVREELTKIEAVCRSAGITEMRHAGDARAWALPDYEEFPALRNGRRKRL